MITLILTLLSTAEAVDPAAPLAPSTIVLGTLPPGLSPLCRQGANTRPYFIAPRLASQTPVQVWDGDPNQGGHLVVAELGGQMVSVIPPAPVTQRSGSRPVATAPVPFWYCMEDGYEEYTGLVLAGPENHSVVEGRVKAYLGTFARVGTCLTFWVDISDTQNDDLTFTHSRCH